MPRRTLTKRERAWVEHEVSSIKQHLVVAGDKDMDAKLKKVRKEAEANPQVPYFFRIPKE